MLLLLLLQFMISLIGVEKFSQLFFIGPVKLDRLSKLALGASYKVAAAAAAASILGLLKQG